MRTNCPLCDSPRRIDDWVMAFKVPDGWPNPTENRICKCLDCDMIYYDNAMTQADYDDYYHKYYGYDGNEHSENNLARLDEIADLVNLPFMDIRKDDLIVDFGGGKDSYLVKKLNEMGYYRVFNVEVGDELPKNIDLLISAQTLEHLYDLKPIVNRLAGALSLKGVFLIEIPSGYEMPYLDPPMPILDYHQKHVNHFTSRTLDLLFEKHIERGPWHRVYSHQGATPCYFGWHYRAIYQRYAMDKAYANAKQNINIRTYQKLEKLRQVRGPVVVWGCGDLCLHMLTKVDLDVLYYVDNDPAFRGATIHGIPVLDRVHTDHPIVIIAQNQATGIIKRIKDLQLENEVILI